MKKKLIIFNTILISFLTILFFYIKSVNIYNSYTYVIEPLNLEKQKKQLSIKTNKITNGVNHIYTFSNVDTINRLVYDYNKKLSQKLLVKKLSYDSYLTKNILLNDYKLRVDSNIHTLNLISKIDDEKEVFESLSNYINSFEFDFTPNIDELLNNVKIFETDISNSDMSFILSHINNLNNYLKTYKSKITLTEISTNQPDKLKFFIYFLILCVINFIFIIYFPLNEIKREIKKFKKEINF